VPVAALQSERAKRQALEQRLRDLEAKLQSGSPPPPPPGPDPIAALLDDPQGFVRSRVEEEVRGVRFELSAQMQRAAAPDYDDAEAALFDYVQAAEASANPVLRLEAEQIRHAIRSSANPAAVALELGRRARALAAVGGDPSALIEREVERRLAERLKTPSPAARSAAGLPSLPASLADARAVGTRTPPGDSGPTPISDIVRFRG